MHALGSSTFRPYHSTDVRGVEIGGAAKNVLAIAAGIVAGKQLGASALAALTTRGFAELMRLGITCGAPTVDSRIVVIEFELKGGDATHVGLRADKVHEVTLLPLADTEGPPSVGLRWRADFIRCLAKQGGELIVVPDLSQIFATRGGASATVVPFAQA